MLRVGYAQIDISPGPDCGLLGFDFRPQQLPSGNAGVHDPLYARVFVFDDGGVPAVLVSLDLCILPNALARHLRNAVAEKLEIELERVIISCTHTHSGPLPELADAADDAECGDLCGGSQTEKVAAREYTHLLQAKLLDAVGAAAGLRYPVTMAVQEAPFGLGYNRRVMTPTGIRHCWNPGEQATLHPGPPTDPTLTVVALRQLAGPRSYLLFSIGVHGVGLGKTSRVVSADWPGLTCTILDALAPGTHAAFFSGAAGDTHPWVATQEDPAQLQPVAAAAASMVSLLAQSAQPVELPAEDTLRVATRTVKAGEIELDLSVWKIGPLYLVAAPVELFGALAVDLRRRLPGPVLLATVSNGWTGYWPTSSSISHSPSPGLQAQLALIS